MRNLVLLLVAGLVWLGVWFDLNYRVLGPDSIMYWAGYKVAKKTCSEYASEISRVDVKWKGRSFSLQRDKDAWVKRENGEEVEMVPYPVEDFLSELLCAQLKENLSPNEEYGIGKDEVVLFWKDGRRVEVELGEDVPGGMGRYCKVGNRVGVLERRYLYLLDRVDSWVKEESDDRGGIEGGPGPGEGRATSSDSGSNGGRGDKETRPIGGQADTGAGQD